MRILLLIIIPFAVGLVSCEKPEGLGGKAGIEGTVKIDVYDKYFTVLQDSYTPADNDVFIIYGDDEINFDETKTTVNGKFKFDNLTQGNYTLYFLTEHNQSLHDSIIYVNAEISENDQQVVLDEITIKKSIDIDEGFGSISGQVLFLEAGNGIITDTATAVEKEVYLYYGDKEAYCERIRTENTGKFVFSDLIKGSYKVAVYGENPVTGEDDILYLKTTELRNLSDNKQMETFFVYKD